MCFFPTEFTCPDVLVSVRWSTTRSAGIDGASGRECLHHAQSLQAARSSRRIIAGIAEKSILDLVPESAESRCMAVGGKKRALISISDLELWL